MRILTAAFLAIAAAAPADTRFPVFGDSAEREAFFVAEREKHEAALRALADARAAELEEESVAEAEPSPVPTLQMVAGQRCRPSPQPTRLAPAGTRPAAPASARTAPRVICRTVIIADPGRVIILPEPRPVRRPGLSIQIDLNFD
ncbi:MAG: hypothetical protein AAGA32_13290 [Pseudomonadota bacterium]